MKYIKKYITKRKKYISPENDIEVEAKIIYCRSCGEKNTFDNKTCRKCNLNFKTGVIDNELSNSTEYTNNKKMWKWIYIIIIIGLALSITKYILDINYEANYMENYNKEYNSPGDIPMRKYTPEPSNAPPPPPDNQNNNRGFNQF